MRLAGRISAAIDVLADSFERHRPASMALADWGRAHRFAGSGDRSAIGTLVYDALRKRASLGWRMGDDSPRGLVLGALRHVWGLPAEEIAALCDGSEHAPAALSDAERDRLSADAEAAGDMPGWIAADVPEWLFPEFEAAFGANAVAEGQGLAERAPIDLRANTLKADRPRVLKALEKYRPAATPISPLGIRIAAPGSQEKNPNVEAEAAHGKGWFEVQDEASQIAVALSGAGPRLQVLDLCAGSGGKTLGMAALMQNTGQIHAFDSDKLRLRPIFERLKRAGARNVQVIPAGEEAALDALTGRMDVVFADAPCSGSGVWRRRPDAKWRLTPEALALRIEEQRRVLERAAPLVRPGGRLVYATCSVIAAENGAQTRWFLEHFPEFAERAWTEVWKDSPLPSPPPAVAGNSGAALQLTPASHGTDGFYISVLERRA
ncbi:MULTISPECIES: RsmB/NOP family class I SAM-dependent RNA methyltransferase [Rhodomicrobium]|uniref:RsmB/NOP family class I SAM-dependent RNA methyltransferase n=1 Tax=Rhodomicrobium TaxID=1068 RepID=UPI000B4AA8C1|nr:MULTISPECIES: RsmB/NOP family class I SAM-dependent RNA methyltransferase [Rhodomicrobium]